MYDMKNMKNMMGKGMEEPKKPSMESDSNLSNIDDMKKYIMMAKASITKAVEASEIDENQAAKLVEELKSVYDFESGAMDEELVDEMEPPAKKMKRKKQSAGLVDMESMGNGSIGI